MRQGAGCIDLPYAGVRMRGAEQLAMSHPRQKDVIGEDRLASYLAAGVDSSSRDTNDP
jgi:hypothetical protein